MELLGTDPELLLQLYDAVFLWLAWALGGSTIGIVVLYLFCLWLECFPASRREAKSPPRREFTLEPRWMHVPFI